MKKIVLYFVLSILLTAVFSYSLSRFLRIDIITLTLKTLLIPCFTWTILILLAYVRLTSTRRMEYLELTSYVCMVGSAVLVPGGLYNFFMVAPQAFVAVINVLVSVGVMSWLYYRLLRKHSFSIKWWIAFHILIGVNMILFYLSIQTDVG